MNSDEVRSFTKAIDALMDEPVTHASMRAFCRRLDDIPVQALAEQLPDYLARFWRGQDIRDDLRTSMEDARDFLEDLLSDEPGGHMANLTHQASARLQIFEEALANVVREDEKDEDTENDAPSGDGDGDEEPVAHCNSCGRTLTHPRSVERRLGPHCWHERRLWEKIWWEDWAEVRVIAPDLAARVDAGEIEPFAALDKFEARDKAALYEIEDRVLVRLNVVVVEGT
jgi:hypothetical protein